MRFAMVNVPTATVYGVPAETKVNELGAVSTITDENLFGSPVRILDEDGSDESEYVHVLSFYGYAGYMKKSDLLPISEERLREVGRADMRVVKGKALDVLSLPSVHGLVLMTLSAGSILRATREQPAVSGGYTKIVLPDTREAYVYSAYLEEKRFGFGYLMADADKLVPVLETTASRDQGKQGGQEGFSFGDLLDDLYGGSEAAFRKQLTDTALSYMGTQYRWGGRSSFGIDCSGLVSMAYLRSGVVIFRDASIVDGFPLRRVRVTRDENGIIGEENFTNGAMKPGDALYFPGHIAMYLGNGKYIHSTGRAFDDGVVINSLRPEDPDYRADLPKILYAVAGLRI